jgi:hypothetical protein
MSTRMDTHPPAPGASPRRHLLRTALLITALVALVAATVLFVTVNRTPEIPAPAAPSSPPVFVPEATADGCLGGRDPLRALLEAQQLAALDSVGAAEFALAFMRWGMTFPFPANADAVAAQVMTDPSLWLAGVARFNQEQQGTGNVYRLIAPETWKYRLVNNNGQQAVVQVYVTREFVPVATQPMKHPLVAEFHLVAMDGRWQVAESVLPTSADPTYTGGFQPYLGGCA